LLLAKDYQGQTVLHVAANRTYTNLCEKVWDWAAEALAPEKTKELLLAKDDYKLSVLHLVEKIWTPRCLR
jgi:hypothetical protein